ncbi:general secretion pathway protein GspB [Pseudidiomarina sp. CB1]|uniref:general secretion pathway protein GspB n=1 Tax=Pseudidiomarina sp. CB1 TaxID=2972484 RepID=UPI0021620139|nr:general secretion pathway protein GspB [Pseudidiomarina sp. CB1]
MSSVLKALRQQQSQLIPPQQPIQLTAAISPSRLTSRWWWLVLPLALLVGWVGAYWFLGATPLTTDRADTVPTAQASSSEPSLTLGQPQQVRVVELPQQEAPEAAPSSQPQPTRSTFEAVPEVAADQALSLDEVPADLLAAFEEAIVATGKSTSTAPPESVLPRIAELERSLRQQIPPFTYDGHQYSSRATERFVELAGQRLRQGDYWQGIQVLTIAPNHVVLALGKDAFQQPALEDWTTQP